MTVAELTTDAIDAMPAGREMDALVAEKVFGLGLQHWTEDEVTHFKRVEPYSTDIAAAMEAADLFPEFHLRRVHWAYLINHLSPVKADRARTHGAIGHYEDGWWAAGTHEGSICSFAETAPLAICRTTLIAKLVEQMKTTS